MNPAGARDRTLGLSHPGRRWFAFADLLCAAASAALISAGLPGLRSPLGGWPLLIALLPWAARVAAGRFPFRRTPLDLPLAGFVLMAGVGAWAAYEPGAAWAKLWMLLAGVLVFYALAGQPQTNLKALAGLLGLLGAGLALAFLLEHDWQAQPADLQLINRIGLRWMAIRPDLPLPQLFPNMVGGMIAMCLPISLAFGLQTWHSLSKAGGLPLLLLAAFNSVLMGVGLVFTSSRGAWLALAVGLGAWVLLEVIKTLRVFKTLKVYLPGILVLTALGVAALVLASPGSLLRLADSLPGLQDSASRAGLARSALLLIADVPYTGGGLGSFAGLFSHYIMVIPVFLFSYAHNFYLDVAVEQGLPGLLALLAVFLGSAGLVLARPAPAGEAETEERATWLDGPLLAALVVVALHGLVDDALYGNGGSPLLFVLPGLAVALSQTHIETLRVSKTPLGSQTVRVWLAAMLLILLALGVAFRRPLLASFYADLGAVRMARVDLAGFPTNQWDDGRNTAALAPAKALFERALAFDPGNRTANYRLGLSALLERDFPAAVSYLEKADQAGGLEHPGIRKNMGFAYVWVGEYDRAIPLLLEVEEAGAELNNYVWFWRGLGRNDLASNASLALSYLQAAEGGG